MISDFFLSNALNLDDDDWGTNVIWIEALIKITSQKSATFKIAEEQLFLAEALQVRITKHQPLRSQPISCHWGSPSHGSSTVSVDLEVARALEDLNLGQSLQLTQKGSMGPGTSHFPAKRCDMNGGFACMHYISLYVCMPYDSKTYLERYYDYYDIFCSTVQDSLDFHLRPSLASIE